MSEVPEPDGAPPSMVDGRLSVIVRFHDLARARLLDEALFSLALQDYVDLEVVLVVQNLDEAGLRVVDDLARGQPWRGDAPHRVVSIDVPPGTDARARLLNEGLQRASGRFVAFLDDDDVVYHDCYTALLGRLRSSGRAVALGGARLALCRPTDDHIYVVSKQPFHTLDGATPTLARLAMFDDNYAPIHSFVIDRARLGSFPLRFDESLERLEDYDLLLRLLAAFEPDVERLSTPVVEYRVRSDGSNTVMLPEHGPPSDANHARWERARATLRARKEQLTCTLSTHDLAEIGRTLRGLRTDLHERQARDAKVPYRLVRALAQAVGRMPRLKRILVLAATQVDQWRATHDRTGGEEPRPLRAPPPWAAVLIIAAFTAVFFAPLALGRTFSTVPGHQVAMWPWAAEPTGHPDAPQSDQAELSRPWHVFTARALSSGTLPHWNPYSFAGQPFLANGTSAVLYPPRLLVVALGLSAERAHDTLCVLHVLAASLLAWAFLRELGCRTGALLGGLAWGLSGFHLAWLHLEVMAPIAAWLPAALLFVHRGARLRSWPSTVAASITGTLLLTSGHLPQIGAAMIVICSYSTLLAVRAVRAGASATELLRPVVVALGAPLLAAIVVLPSAAVILELGRETAGWEARDHMRVPLSLILRGLFLPPPGPATATTLHVMPFVGTLVGLLAMVGALRRVPGATFARVLAIVVVLLVAGTVVLRLVLALAPPLGTLAPLGRLLNLLALALCVLGAIGLDALLDLLARLPDPRRLALARATACAVIALTALQLVMHGRSLNPPFAQVRPEHFFPVTPLVAAIGTATTPSSRVLPLGRAVTEHVWHRPVLFGATAMQFEIPSAGGYDSVVPAHAETLWRVVAGEDPAAVVAHRARRAWASSFRCDRTRLALLPRLGIDLVATAPDIEEDAAFREAARAVGLELLHGGPDGRLYRVRDTQPGPFVVHQAAVVSDTVAALEHLLDPSAPWNERLVIEQADADRVDRGDVARLARAGPPAVTRLTRLGLAQLQVDVTSPAPGWLVVPETWDAGWSALVNGEPAPVLRSHVMFRAVAIPAGHAVVNLSYRPVGLTTGAGLSAVTLVALLTLLVWTRRSGPRIA